MAEEKKQSCGCKLTQLIAEEECSPAPAGLGNTVYFGIPDKPALKCSGTVTLDTDEDAKGGWPESYEITGECLLRESPDALMRMLSRSMRFNRKTLRRLFHAVTHHKQVWFDVVIEFRDGTVDEGGLIVETPHQLRFLLNKIHHIRTRYEIRERN